MVGCMLSMMYLHAMADAHKQRVASVKRRQEVDNLLLLPYPRCQSEIPGSESQEPHCAQEGSYVVHKGGGWWLDRLRRRSKQYQR